MAYVSRPWDGSSGRFTIQEWRASCLIDTGEGDPDAKSRYKLPIKEPNGDINLNGVRAANSRLGSTQAPTAQKAKAKARIDAIRKSQHIGEENQPKS